MTHKLIFSLLLSWALLPAPSAAQPARLPEPVAQALAQAGIPESGAAVYVHEIGVEQPVVAHGADRPLNPASTMKLVTTYAALDLLGPPTRGTPGSMPRERCSKACSTATSCSKVMATPSSRWKISGCC